MPARDEYPIDPGISEAQFQNRVIAAAKLHGWKVSHFRPALQRSGKWSTPVQGHTGFPDLILARDGVVIHAELKTNKGRLNAAQREWAAAIGESYRLWRPRDWEDVLAELMTPAVARSHAPTP